MNEKNFRNETPLILDDKCKFEHIFHHVWESASLSHSYGLERLDWLIKTERYSIN